VPRIHFLFAGLMFALTGFLPCSPVFAASPQITGFDFPGVNAGTYIDQSNHTILVLVPYGTDPAKLEPKITQNGASVERISGDEHGFTNPAEYEVKGDSGEQVKYTVKIIVHHWEELTAAPGWKPRDGAGLVSFRGKLWMLGGWEAPETTSQVWVSEDEGRNWKRLPDAPWPPRHGAGWVVFDDRIWVVAGDDKSDVWSSPDGVNWTEEVHSAPFGNRYTPYVAVFNDRLWVMGGISWLNDDGTPMYPGVKAYNDVWSSTDGRQWTRVLAHAPWAPRGLIHGYAVLGDRLFIMGGGIKAGIGAERGTDTVAEYHDVWYTTNGTEWVRSTDWAAWAARTHVSVASTPSYIYVTDGSVRMQSQTSNEVWRTSNGHTWDKITPVPWTPRHASSLTYHDGRLVLASGFLNSEVWAMDTK